MRKINPDRLQRPETGLMRRRGATALLVARKFAAPKVA